MSMWISHEWFDFGKENSPARVLLAEFGKRLYLDSEAVSSVPDSWESQSSPSYSIKIFVISVALCSMENRHNRRNNAECFKWA